MTRDLVGQRKFGDVYDGRERDFTGEWTNTLLADGYKFKNRVFNEDHTLVGTKETWLDY